MTDNLNYISWFLNFKINWKYISLLNLSIFILTPQPATEPQPYKLHNTNQPPSPSV